MSLSDWYEVDELTRLSQQNATLQAEVARLRQEAAALRTAGASQPPETEAAGGAAEDAAANTA